MAVEQLRQKRFLEESTGRILEEVPEIMNRVERESLNGAVLVEGVPETLKALKVVGLRLGLITRRC